MDCILYYAFQDLTALASLFHQRIVINLRFAASNSRRLAESLLLLCLPTETGCHWQDVWQPAFPCKYNKGCGRIDLIHIRGHNLASKPFGSLYLVIIFFLSEQYWKNENVNNILNFSILKWLTCRLIYFKVFYCLILITINSAGS